MQTTDHLDEIQDLNLAYLLLAQRLLNENRSAAMFRLKIDDDMADLIASLSAAQLTTLSRTNQLLCHFGHEAADRLRQVVDNPRDNGLSRFHASLLMAGQRGASSVAGGEA